MKIKRFFTIIAMTLITTTSANATPAKPLARCPNSPNCVSSQTDSNDKEHFIAPFKILAEPADAWANLQAVLKKQSRTTVTEVTENSLHAEATSLVFRFVDDIDIVLDREAGLIHIRSASRTGYSDFGVNRKRVEKLRQNLQQARIIE